MTNSLRNKLNSFYNNKNESTTLSKLILLGEMMKEFYNNEKTIISCLSGINGNTKNIVISPATTNALLEDVVNVILNKYNRTLIKNIENKYDFFDTSALLSDGPTIPMLLNIKFVDVDDMIVSQNYEVEVLVNNFDIEFLLKLFTILLVIK